MKRFAKTLIMLMATMLMTSLLLNFNACTGHLPFAPEENAASDSGELNFLTFGEINSSLNKKATVKKFIRKKRGGTLRLEHEYDVKNGEVEVEISLKIPPGALDEDKNLMLTIDDEKFLGEFDVVFSKHGTVFNKPAILNIDIEIEDIDLSHVNFEDLDIYYDNQESGEWERMSRDAVRVNVDDDEVTIKVKNAKIPHFSRYAVGWGNRKGKNRHFMK
ncbi:hypothetical protein MJD09_12570 [bacterium]|nr:hypothetical protein [bacterium]